ncbi:VTT domain-containing protein [Alphaproteobacteria bacterium]|nr:VTT domain-containing protein [Alphaproteobacteria bacterium]
MLFKNLRYIIIFFILILIPILLFSDLKNFFTLGYVQENLINFRLLYEENLFLFSLIFSLIYILSSALSLPFATLLTLLSGYIFGLALGTFIVSLCSTIGASIAFLMSKFLFYNYIQNKYKKQLVTINNEFINEGIFYIFALRLVPVFPFFVVNILTSLLPIKLSTFFWVSILGMFPATLVYVNAGNELSKINSFSDILSFQVLISFSLIGILPLSIKFLLKKIRRKK